MGLDFPFMSRAVDTYWEVFLLRYVFTKCRIVWARQCSKCLKTSFKTVIRFALLHGFRE